MLCSLLQLELFSVNGWAQHNKYRKNYTILQILISASVMAGLAVILLESPIAGNNGLYSKLGKRLLKEKTESKENPNQTDKTVKDYSFMTRVGFYGWLDQNGCNRFLDQLNIQNSIENALITGFTISFLISVFGLPFVWLLNIFSDWFTLNLTLYAVLAIDSLGVLIGLWRYNRRWTTERNAELVEIGQEYNENIDHLKKAKKTESRTQ